MINQLRFCLKMIQKYEKIYPKMDIDLLVDIIDMTLNRTPENFFTWDQVQENPQFCKQCGACCRTIDCQYFNGKTCDEYATRFDACVEFPYYEINGESGLMLDASCNLATKLAEQVLDAEFSKQIELLELDELGGV